MPNGNFLYGILGFEHWCKQRKKDLNITKNQYETIFLSNEKFKKNSLIEASEKITKTFQTNFLQKIWYIDFYSWEIFGKTQLGKLILYAKQNSDEILMKKIAQKIQQPINDLMGKENFDLVGLVPHSVPRKKNFLRSTIRIAFPYSKITELFGKKFVSHAVAQKTLKSKVDPQQIKAIFKAYEFIEKRSELSDDGPSVIDVSNEQEGLSSGNSPMALGAGSDDFSAIFKLFSK